MPVFGRQVIVRMGPAGETGKEFRGLRVNFTVNQSTSSTPNDGKIELYNANDESVALVQSASAVVELYVGYDVPRLLFRGNPVSGGVKLEPRGADSVLVIEAQDGGYATSTARVNLSWSTETTLTQVMDALTAQLGLPLGTVRVPTDVRFPSGITLSGSVKDVLSRLATSTGSSWFVTDGALQFLGAGEDTGAEAVLISATTGNLVGSPMPKDDGIEVTALISPGLRPGGYFQLESRRYNGWYLATDVKFSGDNGYSKPFYMTTVGTPR